MVLRKAFPVTNETWKQIGADYDVPDDYPQKYHGMTLEDIAIGTEGTGEEQHFIIEPFFPQILKMVFDRTVKIHIDLYADPAVVVEKDGRIVLHNADVEIIKTELDKVLGQVKEPNRIHAMTEIRQNMYAKNRIGSVTKTVRNRLTELLPKGILIEGRKLNYDFMRLYLMEKYNVDNRPEAGTLEDKLRKMTKTELLSVYGSLIEARKTGATWYEPGATLIRDGHKPDQIEEAYLRELEYRFYSGDIT